MQLKPCYKLEQLIQLTNSGGFFRDWAFFLTGFNLVPLTDRMIVLLEAHHDDFEENAVLDKRSWKIACNGFMDHRLRAGYLIPFYRIKVIQNHPLLWNYGSKTYLSIYGGSCKDIALLMGELFLVHNQITGNWVQFHQIFGFLPKLLEEESQFQLAVPTPLIAHYLPVLHRHEIRCSIETSPKNEEESSVLLFSSEHFPDNYDYGQPYIVAKSFEVIESI